jgi:hypothetical protein
MDNDSGHHADIALRMYLTAIMLLYMIIAAIILISRIFFSGLSAELSYFWRYFFCLPVSFFSFYYLGTYSIFRLGKELYGHEIGKLAALIAASSFCYILANNDVRMDAILTAAIAFATWQLVAYVIIENLFFFWVLH